MAHRKIRTFDEVMEECERTLLENKKARKVQEIQNNKRMEDFIQRYETQNKVQTNTACGENEGENNEENDMREPGENYS
jgi:hypothetical protein